VSTDTLEITELYVDLSDKIPCKVPGHPHAKFRLTHEAPCQVFICGICRETVEEAIKHNKKCSKCKIAGMKCMTCGQKGISPTQIHVMEI